MLGSLSLQIDLGASSLQTCAWLMVLRAQQATSTYGFYKKRFLEYPSSGALESECRILMCTGLLSGHLSSVTLFRKTHHFVYVALLWQLKFPNSNAVDVVCGVLRFEIGAP